MHLEINEEFEVELLRMRNHEGMAIVTAKGKLKQTSGVAVEYLRAEYDGGGRLR